MYHMNYISTYHAYHTDYLSSMYHMNYISTYHAYHTDYLSSMYHMNYYYPRITRITRIIHYAGIITSLREIK